MTKRHFLASILCLALAAGCSSSNFKAGDADTTTDPETDGVPDAAGDAEPDSAGDPAVDPADDGEEDPAADTAGDPAPDPATDPTGDTVHDPTPDTAGDVVTDTHTDPTTEPVPDHGSDPSCDPCISGGTTIPGCGADCGGFAGTPCSSSSLTCVYLTGSDAGICIPTSELGCSTDSDCACFPAFHLCSSTYTIWECLSGSCGLRCA